MINILGEPEIRQLKLTFAINQNVGRLEITMNDPLIDQLAESYVFIKGTCNYLLQNFLRPILINFCCFYILRQVHNAIFHHDINVLRLVNDVYQRDDIWMVEATQNFDLCLEGCFQIRRHIQGYLLYSILAGQVDLPKTPLANYFL